MKPDKFAQREAPPHPIQYPRYSEEHTLHCPCVRLRYIAQELADALEANLPDRTPDAVARATTALSHYNETMRLIGRIDSNRSVE